MSSATAAPQTRRPSGMTAFIFVWLGQLISILASQVSLFGLNLWLYDQAGPDKVTAMAWLNVCFILPLLLISPVAGVMVDRYNRKLMMMFSDLGAGLATVALLVFQALGMMQVWHLYAAAVLYGLGQAFQWPAYSAAITTLVPKEQLGRVNGLMSLMESGPAVLSPLIAPFALALVALTGVLAFDVATFIIAIGMLLVVHIPQPPKTAEGQAAKGNFLQEAAFGFKYIFARPSLLGLQLVFFCGNLFSGIGGMVLVPMILSRTVDKGITLGVVQSVGAVGMILGGVAMSAWGGFKRRVHGVLLGWLLSGVASAFLGFGREVVFWSVVMFATSALIPLINGSNQAIWQSKVAPDLQGRVFTARRLIAWFTNPISPLIAAFLADRLLEPAMQEGGALANVFGSAVGIGPGAGMALLFILTGLLSAVVGLAGYAFPAIRNAEDILPDYGGGKAAAPEAAPATTAAAEAG